MVHQALRGGATRRRSSASNASIDGQRSPGSVAKPRSTTLRSASGTVVALGAGRILPTRSASTSPSSVRPSNGRSP